MELNYDLTINWEMNISDGDQPGARWSGDAHSSTSVRDGSIDSILLRIRSRGDQRQTTVISLPGPLLRGDVIRIGEGRAQLERTGVLHRNFGEASVA